MRRFSLACAATIAAIGTLGLATSASAAVTPGQFNLHFTSAHIVLGDLTTLDVPGTDASLAGKTVDVHANVDGAGNVTAFRDALQFPSIPIDISGIQATVSILQTDKSTGTIDPNTNAVSLPLALGVKIDTSLLPVSCVIRVPFTFDTGSHQVTDSKSVAGSAFDPGSGAITLASVGEIPSTIQPWDQCSADAATTYSGLLSSLLGGGGAPKIGIQLTGTLAMPGGTPYADPDGNTTTTPTTTTTTTTTTTPPPAKPVIKVGALSKVKKNVATLKVSCSGAACAGKATFTYKAKGAKKASKLGAVSYKAAAGKSATIKVKVSSAALKALKKVKGKASVTVTVTGGSSVTKSVKVS